MPVPALIVETEEEKRLYSKGEEASQAKKALRTRSLLQKAPDDEESELIHSMWTKEMSYLSKLPSQRRKEPKAKQTRPSILNDPPIKPSVHE